MGRRRGARSRTQFTHPTRVFAPVKRILPADFQIFPQPVFPTNRAQSIEFNGERQVFHADTVTMSFYPATVTTKYGNGPYYFKLLGMCV